jgi:hypothetical protein
MKQIVVLIVVLLTTVVSVYAQEPDFQAMLVKIDAMSNFKDQDFQAKVNIIDRKPGKNPEAREVFFFRRDTTDAFVLLINEPRVERGQGLLQVDKNLWFYDPNTGEFEHRSLRETFAGSGARNNDFANRNLADDYRIEGAVAGTVARRDVWIITLQARNNQVPVPMQKLYVLQGELPLVLQAEEYSLSGRLMRTSKFTDYVQVQGRYIYRRALSEDNLNPGEQTQMTLSDISLAKIPDEVFSRAYLQRASNR